jgi:hypothetical protein
MFLLRLPYNGSFTAAEPMSGQVLLQGGKQMKIAGCQNPDYVAACETFATEILQ